jgi:hypothetical protein
MMAVRNQAQLAPNTSAAAAAFLRTISAKGELLMNVKTDVKAGTPGVLLGD